MSIKLSWRALIDAKIIKRTDNGMAIRLDAIRLIEGFNLRDTTTPRYLAAMEELHAHMARGGKVPALEVVLSADGKGVDVVEGHRRTLTYLRLVEDGHPIEWVRIEPFEGNDVERTARVLTSQDNLKLDPLEIAAGYRRLASFGLKPEDIARRVCKTRQHVDQMLILDAAPHAVQQMVADGTVKPTTAIDQVRKHGDKAGAVLKDAASKGKVTAGALKPWTPPAKVIAPVVSALESFLGSVDNDECVVMLKSDLRDDETVTVNAKELRDVFDAFGGIGQARQAAENKAAAKQAKAAQGALPGTDGA